MDNMTEAEILELNIPTGTPLVMHFRSERAAVRRAGWSGELADTGTKAGEEREEW